jgi:nucleoside-diphosphate-sugar epimerase
VTQDLVDSVEVESLANVYLWKHPELNITILRPCNVLGPGVRNTMSILLARPLVPVLVGFSPIMQFLHVEDMAEAVMLAFEKNKPGIYNVAPEDYVELERFFPALPDQLLQVSGGAGRQAVPRHFRLEAQAQPQRHLQLLP